MDSDGSLRYNKHYPNIVFIIKILTVFLSMQDVADIRKQFPLLEGDIKFPKFFKEDQFFSSVFRISSPGLQLWTHYDVCYRNEKSKANGDL